MADKLYYCKRCKNSYPALVDSKGQDKIVEFPSKVMKAATNDNVKKQVILESLESQFELVKDTLPESAKNLKDRIAALKSEMDANSKTISSGEVYQGRFLTCQHCVNALDNPVSYGDSNGILSSINPTSPDPQDLRNINIKVTLEFCNKNEEQRANMIAFHVAQYQMLMKAAKEQKYILQVLDEECTKYIEQMGIEKGDAEKKRLMQRFDHITKRPEKRLIDAAKDEEKKKKKEDKGKSTMDAMNKQLEKMRKMMENL